MSAAIQQHFLGCSIRSFNLNMGWGDQSSILEVSLVEDDALFERFDGFIGQLVRFQYSEWIFDGILTSIKEVKNQSINRGWEVVISDPRELLSGVELIIGGYIGFTYSVPNLYNVFGYLESFGYGNSLINDAGIPWRLIRDAFTQLNQITPVYLAGYPYFIDLSLLPDVPNDFRINSTNISLLDFIQQICSLANHEFTVIMTGNYITVLTVSNNIPQLNGSIYRLLAQIQQNYISTEAGFELQYNTANKFLVGGQVEQIYYQFNNIGTSQSGVINPINDDTIARYWGKDLNGNINIATREVSKTDNNEEVQLLSNETFYIDGQPISWPGTYWHNYPTDIKELRAALESYDTWSIFLEQYKTLTDIQEANYSKEKKKIIKSSVHYGKWNRIIKDPDVDISKLRDNNINTLGIKDLAKLERDINTKSNQRFLTQKVYDYIANFAKEHLDKKFMVRIPFVLAKRNEDYSITTSLEIADSGYIEESLIGQAVNNKLLPNYPYFVLNQENKIEAYVRFGPFIVADLDLGELSEDDYYIQDQYIYVKCSVDKEFVYVNKNTAFSPRAVITLPGAIKYNNYASDTDGVVSVLSILEQAYIDIQPDNFAKQAEADFNKWRNQVGSSSYDFDTRKTGLVPQMAAIPIRNNLVTYGPWYTQGLQGKVEFEQDTELTPWNYGGFSQMNAAGTAMVQDVYTTSMIGESGSVEFPGSPLFSIAHQIFAGGPTITQINTSIGENGVTTTYRMDKWSQKPGDQTRHRIEQFKKIHSLRRDIIRKNKIKPNQPLKNNVKFGSFLTLNNKSRKNKTSSPHQMIMSSTYGSGNAKYNTAFMPFYETPRVLDTDDWESIAGCSLDTLFTPFTTDTNYSGDYMPRFKNASGVPNSVEQLNPFKNKDMLGAIIHSPGHSGHSDINISNISGDINVYRSMALRSPIVLAGWGYDINGDIVPENIENPKDWKVGPLDTRWDESRGVWVAGGGPSGYIRDLRVTPSGAYLLFEYDKYSNGSGEWLIWFTAKAC
jgi:hypothetical protein